MKEKILCKNISWYDQYYLSGQSEPDIEMSRYLFTGALKAQNGSARSILLILWQFLQVDSCSIATAGLVEPARLAAFWQRMIRCIAISDSAAIITRAVSGAPIAATSPNTARTCTSTCEGDINTCLFLNQIECNKTSNRRQALVDLPVYTVFFFFKFFS